MTGICGIWKLRGEESAAAACDRMSRALAVYGPDRAGVWDGGNVAVACRLARLLPEDRYDRQPVVSDDGRFVLVADVRLDNRGELADLLGLPTERAAGMADSDILLGAWIAWGKNGIARLYGDFAFAVWDNNENRLTLVRDFPGGRPFFYHQGDGWIAFASMAKGLHALPDVPYAIDKGTLSRHLALLPMRGSGSFFSGIHRVEPGQIVEITNDGRVTGETWYRPPAALPDLADPQPYIDQVRATFDLAVADRLRSTGPITSTLSGGLDSSLVTATAARRLGQTGRRLTAFTHVPLPGAQVEEGPNRTADEGPLARRLVRDHPNIDHVLVTAEDRRIGDTLDQRFHFSEMPALNLCNEVWMTEIARLAAGGRRGAVILTAVLGNMTVSDEGLEGLNSLLYGGRPLAWLRIAFQMVRARSMSLMSLLYLSLKPKLSGWQDRSLGRLTGRPRRNLRDFTLLHPDQLTATQPNGSSLMTEASNIFRDLARGRTERVLSLLWQQELVALANKGMLAQYGVDYRDPMGDRRLIDLCLSLPHALYLWGGVRKGLYWFAFADRIPAEILSNKRKGLQGADWGPRLCQAQETIREEVMISRARPDVMTLIETEELTRLAHTIPVSGDWASLATQYRFRLLRSLSVAHFVRKIDSTNS